MYMDTNEYIDKIKERENIVIEDDLQAFEFICELKENIKYPTRSKISAVIIALVKEGYLILPTDKKKFNEVLDKMDSMVYTLVKR